MKLPFHFWTLCLPWSLSVFLCYDRHGDIILGLKTCTIFLNRALNRFLRRVYRVAECRPFIGSGSPPPHPLPRKRLCFPHGPKAGGGGAPQPRVGEGVVESHFGRLDRKPGTLWIPLIYIKMQADCSSTVRHPLPRRHPPSFLLVPERITPFFKNACAVLYATYFCPN